MRHKPSKSMADEAEEVAVDTNTEEVEQPIEEAPSTEEAIDLEEVERLRKAKSDLTARAKKAEEELRQLKKSDAPLNSNSQVDKDELKLIARGLSDEEIEQAKVIAKGKDVILTEAIKDPMFLAYQTDLKERERKEKAKLGASKGSNETEPEVSGLEPGSSRDAHKKAFEKLVGK